MFIQIWHFPCSSHFHGISNQRSWERRRRIKSSPDCKKCEIGHVSVVIINFKETGGEEREWNRESVLSFCRFYDCKHYHLPLLASAATKALTIHPKIMAKWTRFLSNRKLKARPEGSFTSQGWNGFSAKLLWKGIYSNIWLWKEERIWFNIRRISWLHLEDNYH